MELPFVLRRYFHVFAVDIGQVSVRIMRRGELRIFKSDHGQGQHRGALVRDAVAVDDRSVGITGGLADSRKQVP